MWNLAIFWNLFRNLKFQALTYCGKSFKYLKEHASALDDDKQAVESGGDAAARRANLVGELEYL